MKMDLINTEEYPQADRQYKDRLFRFIFQRPADLPDLYNAVNGTDYSDPGALECETVMLNINYGHNRALMEKCRRLKEYAIFVATVRENLERPLPLREAVAEAVDTCIENNALRDILLEQKAEVIQMVLETFDQEKYEQAMHQEGYEDGYQDGRRDLLRELIQKKLAKGRSIEAIAGELEVAPETVQELAKQT